MTHRLTDCERATRADFAIRNGDDVPAKEQVFLEEHLKSCEECRLERAVLDSFAAGDRLQDAEALDELSRRRLVDSVLADTAAREENAPLEPRRLLWAAVGFAACAAIALGLTLFFGRHGDLREPRPASPEIAGGAADRPEASSAGGEDRHAEEASIDDHGSAKKTGVSVIHGKTLLSFEDAVALSVEDDTAIELEDGDRLDIRLARGSVLVSIDPSRWKRPLAVRTPHGASSAKGTVFGVTAREDATETRVYRGTVEVSGPDGTSVLSVEAGWGISVGAKTRRWRLTDEDLDTVSAALLEIAKLGIGDDVDDLRPAASLGSTATAQRHQGDNESDSRPDDIPRKEPTAADLKERAHEAWLAKDWPEAARAYTRLVELYPSSEHARAALLSLGQLELEKLGQPKRSLAHFQRYLDRFGQGPLAQEALWGKCRSLARLGRVEEERAALEAFLERFPAAITAPRAKKRLAEIE